MTKTTRSEFKRIIEEKKEVYFDGVIGSKVELNKMIEAIEKNEQVINERVLSNDIVFSECYFTSNAMKRKIDDGYSTLYFEKGDFVEKHEIKDYIIFIYNGFNRLLYLVKK